MKVDLARLSSGWDDGCPGESGGHDVGRQGPFILSPFDAVL